MPRRPRRPSPAVFKVAYDRWIGDDTYDGRLGEFVAEALALLENVAAGGRARSLDEPS